MVARVILSAAAVALLALSGCGPAKLDESRTWTLTSGDANALDLPAQPKPQKITVEYESSAAPVGVFVFKEADAAGEDGLLAAVPGKALGSQTGEKAGTVTADVPENTPVRVVVRAGAKTEVKLRVTNQKK